MAAVYKFPDIRPASPKVDARVGAVPHALALESD